MGRQSAAFVWSDRALFVGDRSATADHAHHAIEISVALDERGVDVSAVGGADLRGVRGALVRSGTRHRLAIPGPKVAVLYVDPRSGTGAALHARLGADAILALDASLAIPRDALRAVLEEPTVSVDRAAGACDALLRALTTAHVPVPIDARVRRVLTRLEATPTDPPSLAELAATAGLSTTRLRHLFKEQVGLPLSRYALWMRLRTALVRAMSGASMAEAAHEAGFSDAAHFTRTCRQMFGLPPSAFAPVDTLFVS